MSLKCTKMVWDSTSLKGNNRYVLSYLAYRATDEGECWPSVGTIAKEIGISLSTVKKVLKHLTEYGWISKTHRFEKRGGGMRKTSNYYQLNLRKLQADVRNVEVEVVNELGEVITPPLGRKPAEDRPKADHKRSKESSTERSGSLIGRSPASELINEAFETFWQAGLVKRAKPKAKVEFFRQLTLLGLSESDAMAFAQQLATDIHTRLEMNQFGIDKLHPTTYLKQQRWEDEHETPRSSNSVMHGKTAKLSSSDRYLVEQIREHGEQRLLEVGLANENDVRRLWQFVGVPAGVTDNVVESTCTVLHR